MQLNTEIQAKVYEVSLSIFYYLKSLPLQANIYTMAPQLVYEEPIYNMAIASLVNMNWIQIDPQGYITYLADFSVPSEDIKDINQNIEQPSLAPPPFLRFNIRNIPFKNYTDQDFVKAARLTRTTLKNDSHRQPKR